jgi:hypothetical protein
MTQLQSHLHMIHLAPPGLQVQDSAQHIWHMHKVTVFKFIVVNVIIIIIIIIG